MHKAWLHFILLLTLLESSSSAAVVEISSINCSTEVDGLTCHEAQKAQVNDLLLVLLWSRAEHVSKVRGWDNLYTLSACIWTADIEYWRWIDLRSYEAT